MEIEAASFKPVPSKNPIREPKPDLMAFEVLFSLIISAIKAPTNGPIINPIGGKKKTPTISPAVAPLTPAFDPPKDLVPQIGII